MSETKRAECVKSCVTINVQHRVAKGSNGGTFFKFPGKSMGKGSEGLHELLITDQEVGGSIPSGRTISTPVFPSSLAFCRFSLPSMCYAMC